MIRLVRKTHIYFLFASIFFVILFSSILLGQKKRPFSPEDLSNLKRLSDPQISPYGDRVAFVVTQLEKNKKTNSDIWIVSRDGDTLKRITNNPGPRYLFNK